MIKIICGGKKHLSWAGEAIEEYEKRLRKPYDLTWVFMDEDKLAKFLDPWPFTSRDFVICCDERGQNISSDEYSRLLEKAFISSRQVVILIGGAYGFQPAVRERSDFVWSFSKLVFPHMLARAIVASTIARGTPYHH